MRVWVDADSCPKNVRDLLIKAAGKRRISMVFVADRLIPLPHSRYVAFRLVQTGTNRADAEIVKEAQPTDLVISRDIPLASRLVASGIRVIDDRGHVYCEENIGERLSMRNLMCGLREEGIQAERTYPAGPRELKAFADAFDREITRLSKSVLCQNRAKTQ